MKGRSSDWPAHVERYKAWLRRHAGRFDFALNVDVIGDAEASFRAWLDLRAEGLETTPVWHEGDPEEHLRVYDPAARLVALGRIRARRNPALTAAFYARAFDLYPGGRFHALGNSTPGQLEPYPFESFDAVSWQTRAAMRDKNFGWPLSACSKDTAMGVMIEAIESIEHRPNGRPLRPVDGQAVLPGFV